MDLSTKLVKDFAKMVNESSSEEKISTQIYGTVRTVNEAKYVQLDGSNEMTPISEVVDAQDGDRVMVSIENHKATIVGNFTYPPSARKTNDALANASDAMAKSKEALDATEEYSEQISAANAAAQEAKANAAQAGSLATEASTKANEVYTLAEEAKSAAQEATSKAADAMTNVNAANEALSALQTEVSGVKTDISTIRSGVQSDLETFTETISATYAGKTDLTTLEGTLKAEISKSAGELRTTMSDNYVAKSEHVTVKENLQTQITQNAEGISSSAKKITKLETDTTEAQKAIDAAQKDADDALAAAGEAQTKANAAQTAAGEATAKAEAADAALKTANSELATAKANLAEVSGRVDATEADILEAEKAVKAAEEKVTQAKADAAAANAAAGEAKTAASNAQTKANEAKEAADKAQEDADALKTRVTNAETKIDQTAEAIKLLATKTEVTNALSGYPTTAQMEAAINVKADSITSAVSATYATKDSISGAIRDASYAKTTAEQTADKFSWIVESGDNSTNFTITERMATLTADYINLNGLVQFSGLNSDTQNRVDTAVDYANQALSKSEDAYGALEDVWEYNDALAGILVNWCYNNDVTVIDGSKIYTGTIDASKISVTSLSAICATIGGFTIGDNSLEAAVATPAEIKLNFAGPADNPTYYGEIRLGNTTSGGTNFHLKSYDAANKRWIKTSMGNMSGGIQVSNTSKTDDSLYVNPDGITRGNVNQALYFNNDFAFEQEKSIGTSTYPTGDHYLANAKYIKVKNSSGTAIDVIGANSSNQVVLGNSSWDSILVNNDMILPNANYLQGKNNSSTVMDLIGVDTSNVIHLGTSTAAAITVNNNLRFSSEYQVGTSSYPTGNHVLANGKGVYCLPSNSTDAKRIIGTNTSDQVELGNGAWTSILVYNDMLLANANYLQGKNSSGSAVTLIGIDNTNYIQLGSSLAAGIKVNHDMILPNASYIYGKNKAGDKEAQVVGLSSNDNVVVGVDDGTVNNVNIYAGSTINMYQGVNGNGRTKVFSLSSSGLTVTSDTFTLSATALTIPCVYDNGGTAGNYIRVDEEGVFRRNTSSSRRYKEAITEKLSEHLNPHKLYDIPIVEFVYKDGHISRGDERYGQKIIGFIAEDVDDIYPIAANHNKDGSVENWNADFIIPGMLKLIQEQHKVDIKLDSQVETLKNQLDEAMIKIASLEKQIDILKTA